MFLAKQQHIDWAVHHPQPAHRKARFGKLDVRLYGDPASDRKGDLKLHFCFSTKKVHVLRRDTRVYDSLAARFYFLSETAQHSMKSSRAVWRRMSFSSPITAVC